MTQYYNSRYALLAAAIMHIEGAFSIFSKAFRTNNPGNIKRDNTTFWTFPTKLDGFNHLLQYIETHSSYTVRQFVEKYAPSNENNTAKYLLLVLEYTGWKDTDILFDDLPANERPT